MFTNSELQQDNGLEIQSTLLARFFKKMTILAVTRYTHTK